MPAGGFGPAEIPQQRHPGGQREPMTPITAHRALELAREQLISLDSPMELVIQEEETLERDFGWIFFISTKKYLQTKNPGDLIPGIGPLVVERATGSAQFLATSVPPH